MVVEICRRLDGIPLAIELAAARARAIDVAEIARRLDERFGLLKAMRRGSDPRHRTMHDAISWSYDLLAADEQELFTALSVFAGPFDLALGRGDVQRRGDALDLLTRLTERSMLSVRRPAGGGTRYELLETLARRTAGRRLDDDRAVELFTAHAAHFAAEAASVETDLQGPDEARAMARAERRSPTCAPRNASRWRSATSTRRSRLIGSIREFAMRAMRYEVFAWADAACRTPRALDHPLAPAADRDAGVRRVGARRVRPRRLARPRDPRGSRQALGVAPSGLAERVLANVLYIVDRSDAGNVEVGPAGRARRGVGQSTRGWCTPATWRRSR